MQVSLSAAFLLLLSLLTWLHCSFFSYEKWYLVPTCKKLLADLVSSICLTFCHIITKAQANKKTLKLAFACYVLGCAPYIGYTASLPNNTTILALVTTTNYGIFTLGFWAVAWFFLGHHITSNWTNEPKVNPYKNQH